MRQSPPPDELTEVFARYGLAMYNCQVIEDGMVNSLMVLTQVPLRGSIALADADRVQEQLYRLTFGALVDRLEAVAPSRSDLIARLRKAGDHRNWLAHDFWRVRVWEVSSREGRLRTLSDLQTVIESLEALNRELLALVREELARCGMPGHVLDAVIEEARFHALTGLPTEEWTSLPGSRDRYRGTPNSPDA